MLSLIPTNTRQETAFIHFQSRVTDKNKCIPWETSNIEREAPRADEQCKVLCTVPRTTTRSYHCPTEAIVLIIFFQGILRWWVKVPPKQVCWAGFLMKMEALSKSWSWRSNEHVTHQGRMGEENTAATKITPWQWRHKNNYTAKPGITVGTQPKLPINSFKPGALQERQNRARKTGCAQEKRDTSP